MKIICNERDKLGNVHGIFEQSPDSHIKQKAGCPKCSYMDRNKSRRLSFEDYKSKFEPYPFKDEE